MRCEKLIILIVIGIFLIGSVSAVCTVTFDKSDYVQTETVTATLTCGTPQERNQIYSVNWTNSSGALIHQDNGTTPGTTGEIFYEDYILPSTYLGAINATLSGNLMEGEDTANVTALAAGGNENILVISNSSFGGGYIGLVGSIQGIVKDENSKKISGGRCMISGWSNDETQMILEKETFIVNGDVKASAIISAERFDEGIQYAYKILCYCGSVGSGTECVDEDGNHVNNSIGSTKGSFEIQTWLEVNTVTDKSLYTPRQELFICVNLTNVGYSSRIPVNIYHQVRCSAGQDNNNDTDRALIISDDGEPDDRGISSNTTQMQCKRFLVPDAKYLQGKTSECYASTNVWVLGSHKENLLGYATTSPVFNITLNNLQLYANWERVLGYEWNAIINLSTTQYQEYSGIGTGTIKIHLSHPELFSIDSTDQYGGNEMPFTNMLIAEQISNITATNSSGDILTTSLHYKKQGQLDLYISGVDISSTGWYNITLNLNSFEERQVVALEGVENKTGTFHLSVDCPSTADVGSNMNCSITAQVESSQVVEKEVDFTCYITDGVSEFSSLNYNQMINRTSLTLYKEFLVLSSFSDGTQYVLQCHADYYNFGSRRDSFYDTFVTSGITAISSGSSQSGDGGFAITQGASITGGAIDEEGRPIDKDIPFIPDEKEEWIMLLIVGLIIIGILFVLLKKEIKISKKFKFAHLRILFGTILLIILLLVGGNYGYKFTKDKFIKIGDFISYSFVNDPLIRGMALVIFIVFIIIILFKTLNIRMEIKLGEDIQSRNYYHDKKTSKLQHKINREILKHELVHAKKKIRKR